jgi:hypothetical protein
MHFVIEYLKSVTRRLSLGFIIVLWVYILLPIHVYYITTQHEECYECTQKVIYKKITRVQSCNVMRAMFLSHGP